MNQIPVLCALLVFVIILSGCLEDSGVSTNGSNPITCPACCDDTSIAIGIALNDPEVRTYLKDPYTIADIHPNATVTLPWNSTYVTIATVDVIVDTPGNLVHAYVDVRNCTVLSVWPQPKRMPVYIPPNTTTIDPVGDYVVGDVFTVSGTSPLPAANVLFLEIRPIDFKPPPGNTEYPRIRTAISTTVQTVDYRDGISRWYFAVNSTELLPNVYEVWVWSDRNNAYWEGTMAQFNLIGRGG
jgi:hypothetical protein